MIQPIIGSQLSKSLWRLDHASLMAQIVAQMMWRSRSTLKTILCSWVCDSLTISEILTGSKSSCLLEEKRLLYSFEKSKLWMKTTITWRVNPGWALINLLEKRRFRLFQKWSMDMIQIQNSSSVTPLWPSTCDKIHSKKQSSSHIHLFFTNLVK